MQLHGLIAEPLKLGGYLNRPHGKETGFVNLSFQEEDGRQIFMLFLDKTDCELIVDQLMEHLENWTNEKPEEEPEEEPTAEDEAPIVPG